MSTLLKRQLARKVFPVHRLDHRTSGAILFAFDSQTCGQLQQALTFSTRSRSRSTNNTRVSINNGEIVEGSKKEYIALLRGDWKRKFGNQEQVIINKPLNVKGISKDATTTFKLLTSYPGNDDNDDDNDNDDDDDSKSINNNSNHDGYGNETIIYSPPSACSLVLCTPETGRTHQIRRHAYAMGFPVIGDSRHGDSKINRWWRENRNLNRLFLHCLSLDLPPLAVMDAIKLDGSFKKNHDYDEDDIEIDYNSVQQSKEREEEAIKELKINVNINTSLDRINCIAPLPQELVLVFSKDHHDDEKLSNMWMDAKTKDGRLELMPYDDRGGTYGRHFRNDVDTTQQQQ